MHNCGLGDSRTKGLFKGATQPHQSYRTFTTLPRRRLHSISDTMHALALVTASLATLAGAVPTSESKPSENIAISNFTVRKDSSPSGTKINVVDFKLSGKDASNLSCTAQSPDFPTPKEVTTCGDSKYRFSLHAGKDGNEFSLRIYHELGLA